MLMVTAAPRGVGASLAPRRAEHALEHRVTTTMMPSELETLTPDPQVIRPWNPAQSRRIRPYGARSSTEHRTDASIARIGGVRVSLAGPAVCERPYDQQDEEERQHNSASSKLSHTGMATQNSPGGRRVESHGNVATVADTLFAFGITAPKRADPQPYRVRPNRDYAACHALDLGFHTQLRTAAQGKRITRRPEGDGDRGTGR